MSNQAPVLGIRNTASGLLLVVPAMYRLSQLLHPDGSPVSCHLTDQGLELVVPGKLELVMTTWQRMAVKDCLASRQEMWMADHHRRYLTKLLARPSAS